MSIRSVALLIYFAGSLPVCFFRPFYGILLWIAIAFLNPQSYLWGDAAILPLGDGGGHSDHCGGPVIFQGVGSPFGRREVVLLGSILDMDHGHQLW